MCSSLRIGGEYTIRINKLKNQDHYRRLLLIVVILLTKKITLLCSKYAGQFALLDRNCFVYVYEFVV